MTAVSSGVFPVHNHVFEIGADAENLNSIANLETANVTFDNGVEEWHPFEGEGWVSRLLTSKSVTAEFSGKRTIGDTGQEFVVAKKMVTGQLANGVLKWTFPSGSTLVIPGVISVTNDGGGDSTNVAPLEFSVMSNGKPTFTPPASNG